MRNLIAGSSLRTRIAGAAATLLLAAALPATASADLTGYFQGHMPAGISGRVADVSRTLLTSSGIQSNCGSCEVWAGAHYAGGTTLYASWATGTAYACHNYGTANIGAMAEAPYLTQDIFLAVAGWSGSGGATYC